MALYILGVIPRLFLVQSSQRISDMTRISVLFTLFSLLCLGVSSSALDAGNNNDIFAELDPSSYFRGTPKNVLFGVTAGGSSHHSWVMRVLDELVRRGHNVTYATTVSTMMVKSLVMVYSSGCFTTTIG